MFSGFVPSGYEAIGVANLDGDTRAAGRATATALLTDDRSGQGHDTLAHCHTNRIRGNVGGSNQGRLDPNLERQVGRTLGCRRRRGAKVGDGDGTDHCCELKR